MAQWLGQFSGLSHATRVEDAERALRAAVSAHHTALAYERPHHLNALRKLATRLLRARLKALKASLALANRIATAEALARRARHIAHLHAAQAVAVAGGVDAILLEFGVS